MNKWKYRGIAWNTNSSNVKKFKKSKWIVKVYKQEWTFSFLLFLPRRLFSAFSSFSYMNFLCHFSCITIHEFMFPRIFMRKLTSLCFPTFPHLATTIVDIYILRVFIIVMRKCCWPSSCKQNKQNQLFTWRYHSQLKVFKVESL